ncbi:MAG: helix-turn-helix transcriptional regulator [Chitinophagaceae bacterium]
MKIIPIRQISSAHQELSAERFKIRQVQDILDGSDLKQELHRHNFFFMLVLQNGSGMHEIDFTSYPLVNNCIFFLRPGQVHQLELKAGCTGFLLEFNTAFYHPKNNLSIQRLRKASNKNYCTPGISSFEKLYAILMYIFQEYADKAEGYLDVIKANMDIFFIEVTRQSPHVTSQPANTNSYAQERLEEFVELVEINIATHKQVAQYSDLMNLSPYQLNEITRSTVGKTASALINDHIILEAKRYLLATPNLIKEIADQLGYEDTSYFTRFFRKQTGYSPEIFRHNSV